MKLNITLLLSGIFLLAFRPGAISQCADPSNIHSFEFNGSSYEIVMEFAIWTDAAACAVERGGYLAEINSQEEQEAILDAIQNGAEIADNYTVVDDGGGIAYVWIGGTDTDEEGIWRWEGEDKRDGPKFWTGQGANGANDGMPYEESYVNWGGTGQGTPQEPDNSGPDGQDYAAIGLAGWPKNRNDFGETGEWNDLNGLNFLYYVIEYDPVVSSGGIYEHRPGRGSAGGAGNEPSVRLYPNPTRGTIHLETSGKAGSGTDHSFVERLELYDFTGRRLGTYRQFPADLSTHGKGVFLAKIHTSEGTLTQKLVVR